MFKRSCITMCALYAAVICVASACDIFVSPFDPCPETEFELEDVGQMDQTWTLQTVDNRPLPYKVPFKSDTVRSLTLNFQTDNFERGSECADIKKSYGRAVARVSVSTGGVRTIKEAAGRFYRDHTTNSTRLYAFGYQMDLNRASLKGTTMIGTSSSARKDDGSSAFLIDPDYTLGFIRTRAPQEPLFHRQSPLCSVGVGATSTGASSC